MHWCQRMKVQQDWRTGGADHRGAAVIVRGLWGHVLPLVAVKQTVAT